MHTLPENPKDLIGHNKIPLHLFPAAGIISGALGNLDGALKYGRSNWREAGIRYTVYLDAIRRHAIAALEGEDIDPDSGLSHESHILASAAIIEDAKACGTLIDDRNYKGSFWRSFIDKATQHVARLREKHRDNTPKHWTIGDRAIDAEGNEFLYVNNEPSRYEGIKVRGILDAEI